MEIKAVKFTPVFSLSAGVFNMVKDLRTSKNCKIAITRSTYQFD